MIKYVISAVLSIVLLSNPAKAESVDVHLLMSDIAGMSMEDAHNKGMGRTIMEMALENAGLSYSIEFLPWSRLLKKVERDPRAVTLPLARTKEREGKYTWLKKIFKAEIGFVSSRYLIDNVEEAQKLKQVSVWRDTFFEKFLMDKGFQNLARFEGDERLGKLFESGRANTWFGELNESRYRLKQYYKGLEQPFQSLFFGKPIIAMDVWLVASPSFDEKHKGRLIKALNEIYKTGQPEALHAKYYDMSETH